MHADGDGRPGSYTEALAMIAAGLDYLGAAVDDLPDAVLGEVLLGLQAAGARHAAVRSSVLARFDAADAHDADAYQNSSSWLRDRAGMTQPAARRQLKQARILRSRPHLAGLMRAGLLSESWLEKITAWTRSVPDDMVDFTDQMIAEVLAAGGDLDAAVTVIAKILESEHAQEQQDPDDPGTGGNDGFDDRSLRLETTLGGAGVLHGNLTPEAAAAIGAVLESLAKKKGTEDTRTPLQRNHDALLDAADRLLGSRLLPARAGSHTRAEVRIGFADLAGLPGAETLTEAWLTGQTAEPGWLTGKDAEAAACGALIAPVVTATPDWDVAAEMICLVAEALGHHAGTAQSPDAGHGGEAGDRPPLPLPPEAWQALLYAVGKLAVKFVSGPGSIASLLRTGLLPAQFSTKSVPLDVGISSHIPDSIRRAVIARAGGHCEWPGGCDVPASASDVHHIVHRKDGGPTSVKDCVLFCGFHHDVCVHRWGWIVDLQADGTITATSPDGTQLIRGHPNRGPAAPPGGKPPPARAA